MEYYFNNFNNLNIDDIYKYYNKFSDEKSFDTSKIKKIYTKNIKKFYQNFIKKNIKKKINQFIKKNFIKKNLRNTHKR